MGCKLDGILLYVKKISSLVVVESRSCKCKCKSQAVKSKSKSLSFKSKSLKLCTRVTLESKSLQSISDVQFSLLWPLRHFYAAAGGRSCLKFMLNFQ
jgi:hypothetical protein